MKIKNLRIQNYKSIKDQKFEECSDVNMFFGHNNSGKSNALKFIDLVFSTKVGEPIFWKGIIENQRFIFRNNNWKDPILFTVEIEEPKNSFASLLESYKGLGTEFMPGSDVLIGITGRIEGLDEYTSEIKLDSVDVGGKNIYNREPEEVYFKGASKSNAGLAGDGYKILESILGQFNNSVLLLDNDRYFQREFEETEVKSLTPKTFKKWFHNYSLRPDRYQDYLKIIRAIGQFKAGGDAQFINSEKNSPIDTNLQFEYYRIQNEIGIILKNQTNNRLPLDSYGTGIQQIFFILGKIFEVNPKIVLIEELELNLSPKYQDELLKFLLKRMAEKNSPQQIFFTTHSPILCFRTQFRIFSISIGNDGETKAKGIGDIQKEISDFYPKELRKFILDQATPKAVSKKAK